MCINIYLLGLLSNIFPGYTVCLLYNKGISFVLLSKFSLNTTIFYSSTLRSKEFIDCVAHLRTLSWLLLGSLQHSALTHNSASFLCQPIPLEANTHIAEHIQVREDSWWVTHPYIQIVKHDITEVLILHYIIILIQVILAGFAEQSKASVLHMSSLFHAFILCQLWTMYCENISSQNPPGSDQYHQCLLILSDFWAKITPALLQLVCHSKSVSFNARIIL